MSMKDKLIELLKSGQGDNSYYITTYAAEKVADHLIANGVTVQRWIPVGERLPDKKEIVLFFGSTNGKVYRGRYSFTGRNGAVCFAVRGERSKETIYSGITHWMPLSEPPKGE